MSGRVLWKFAVTAIIFAWSIASITPIDDTPFADYITETATADTEEFKGIVDRAVAQAEAGEAISPYAALRDIAGAENIDLFKYFPEIPVADIPSLEKRNNVLMQELLKRSKGKLNLGLDLIGGISVTFRVDETEETDQFEREQQLSKAVEILRKRLDGSGVAEPIIRVRGEDRIEVQLPGENTRDNPEIVNNLKAPARLEFRLVHRDQAREIIHPSFTPQSQYPVGYEVLTTEDYIKSIDQVDQRQLFVKRIPEAKGDIIKSARAGQNPENGQWSVQLTMTNAGADQLFDLTSRILQEDRQTNSKQPLAIVLDGELYSAPVISRDPLQYTAEITGDFSQREAVELANVLNNPLDVPLIEDAVYEVGPTLAKDAQESSKQAMMWGGILVITFMLIYYWIGGSIAVIAGFINVTLVLGVMASFGATLTLPGVAALVLTLGMGVDANILIFERIREELAEGKSLKAALQSGFDKALSTILDANITTLITAGILIWLGTGPVKGFGITLAIGIFASVIAALIFSRGFLEFLVESNIARKVLGFPSLPIRKIEFLKFRKVAFASAWALVLAGAVTTGMRIDQIFGVDFRGGDETSIRAQVELSSAQIEAVAEANGFEDVVPVFQTEIGTGLDLIKLQTKEGTGKAFFDALTVTYPDAGIEELGTTTIGSSVTGEIQRNAIYSVLAALVGILMYVALRFEFGYGLGAVVATIHDVFMTVGLFVIFGGQFTAPMLAAILMIVGYSINDTIVVFDRIREELGLDPDATLTDIVHKSINRVLSRTVWTSLTTLLAAGTLWIFGAGVIQDFAMIFVFGILTGTFSSIFIATPIFFWWHKGDRSHVEANETPLRRYEWEVSTKESRGES